MHPKLFEIPRLFQVGGVAVGPFTIYTYGVLLATAYLVGLQLALVRSKRHGLSPARVLDLGVYVIFVETGSRVRSVPMLPAVLFMRLTSALGLSPLGPYHALMYGRSLWFDIAKAQRELGWQPRFSNAEMFAQTYDWYLANREKALATSGASHHRSAVKQGVLALAKHLL